MGGHLAGGAANGPPAFLQPEGESMDDPVNHPKHYTSHPSGIECIQVTEHMNFNRGNAVKYIWRADDKGDTLQNLQKARWYIEREIARLQLAKLVEAAAKPRSTLDEERFARWLEPKPEPKPKKRKVKR
jgi:hypothetical protein